MDRLMVDGNAVAGLLQEVFAIEATTAMETCGACGTTEAIGALHVFRGAGVVLRCPRCGEVLATVVKDESRVWMGFGGVRMLQVNASRDEEL